MGCITSGFEWKSNKKFDKNSESMKAEEVQKSTLTSLSMYIAEIASAKEVVDKLESSKVIAR